MINLKNLKSIFIEGDEDLTTKTTSTPNKNKEEANQPSPPTTNISVDMTIQKEVPPSPTPSTESASTPKAKLDKRAYGRLMAAIESNNLEGFDYLEFKNSLHALAKLPLDESTRFQSAFATAAASMDLTMEKLLQSAEFYKSVLAKEKEAFKKALKGKIERDIATKEQERKQLRQAVTEKQEEVHRLQRLIEKHQQKLTKIDAHMGEIKTKVAQARDNFLLTYEHIHTKIDEDVVKIKKYL